MVIKYGSGDRFKQAKKQIGITQKELASALEVSPAYLSLIATNRQPMSEPIAVKMEKLYGISARWLLYGIGTECDKNKSRLRIARDELGLSQKDLAAQLGISTQYLGLMERNEQPISQPVAIKMEQLFGFCAEWLLFEKGPQRMVSIIK